MKCIFTSNGCNTLYLSPETELEKLLLADIFKTEVTAIHHSTIQVGGKNMVDAIEIISTPAPKQG